MNKLSTGCGGYHLRFDTAGEREVEVQELADAVRAVVAPAATVQRPAFSPQNADSYVGATAACIALWLGVMVLQSTTCKHRLQTQLIT